MRALAKLFAGLVLATGAVTQSPALAVADIPPQRAMVAIDGELLEWDGALTLELTGADLVAHVSGGAPWKGEADLSATLYVSYDAAHLYLAGRVVDDQLVRERGAWHRGDAIEVFLDFAPDRRPAGGDEELRDDRLQIFLMPLNPGRSWGVVRFRGQDSEFGGAGLSGVRVAHRELPGTGYTFEAALPLHNFPAYVPGTRRIGLDIALDDRDGASRYQYMTWSGDIPASRKAALPIVQFAGERTPLEAVAVEPPDLGDQLRRWGGYLLWPALVLIIGGLCLRTWTWVAGRRASLRLLGQLAGVMLLAAGLALPGWLGSLRERAAETDLDSVVSILQRELPKMERGTLGSYRGGERDRPFVDLLSGRPVPRVQTVTHERLADLAISEFGAGTERYPSDFDRFPLRPYWIPLRNGATEQFSFDPPIEGAYLNTVFALPSFRRSNAAPVVRISVSHVGEREPWTGEFDLQRHLFTSCITLGYPEREMTFAQLGLRGPVHSIALSASGADELRLVGLTAVPTPDEDGVPLYLGQPSLGGVETELRGGYPEEAGLRLAPGQTEVVRLDPAVNRSFETLFLFYKADYPRSDRPLPFRGEMVSEVVLRFRGGQPEPIAIPLHHQETMFFELAGQNQDAEPLGQRASVAFRWEDEEHEQHLTLGYEQPLPDNAVVDSIEFRNLTQAYTVHFRSAVFRSSKPVVRVEPPDSPLQLSESRDEVKLADEMLAELSRASFAIYRSGVLQQSTQPGVATNLPRGLERSLSPDRAHRRVVELDDGRVYESYVALTGEGWSGAVLGVFVVDPGHGGYLRWVHRIAVLLCLVAAPVLLSLFSELLMFLQNMRLRLTAVLTVAGLVPLAVLSVVLVRVLENDHESRLRGGVQQAMSAATRRLDEQQRELLAAARKWLDSLIAEVDRSGLDPQDGQRTAALRNSLEQTMASQRPPDWNGGFLRLEVSGQEPGAGVTAFVGDSELLASDTPLRKDPGVYVAWGQPLLGVRWERDVPGVGLCSLSVARPIDKRFIAGLSPGRGVLLCDTRGYPLAVAEGSAVPVRALERSALRPVEMEQRRDVLAEVLDTGQPVVARHGEEGRRWIAAYDVLRDLEETPRALLGIVDADQEAVLPLAMGAVPVRSFFLVVASLLVLLAGFMSLVVTSRISAPIERLERGARALSRGEFDVQVECDERGEIGRLTSAFNKMAHDLRGRIQDMHHLNRGMRALTSNLDLQETVAGVIGFCARHSGADRVRVLLRDPERDGVQVYGGEPATLDRHAPDVSALLAATGPLSMRLRGEGAIARCFADYGSCVALPLVLAGRCRGAIMLLFEAAQPNRVHLELLTTLAAQAATALENARLYLYAVEDPETGAFVPEPFRRRVASAVREAEADEAEVAVLELALLDGVRLRENLGREAFAALLERVAVELRRTLPADTVLCRATEDSLQALLLGTGAAAAATAAQAVRAGIAAATWPESADGLRVHVATAVFPDEAASAEFLFHALVSKREAVAAETPMTEQMRALESQGFALQSPAMQAVYRTLARVAPTDLTVLLEGETGTGKEVLTNLIHAWSKRASGPLVKVHCAALSESLLQSELFGHEKGAFTGAIARKIGKFEQAQGGTIFLDEIGEISLDTQVKLLRVLQEREIDRVGGLQPVPVDVRVVAATNRDVRAMVAAGTFREDLYYRLQGMVVQVPPLRERKREIPALVEFFRREAVAAGQTEVQRFTLDALDELFRRPWPGNIRELRNTVLRAMVLATGEEVRRDGLLGVLGGEQPMAPVAPVDPTAAVEPAAQERTVVLPRPDPGSSEAARCPDDRLGALMALLDERGTITTQDYVAVTGVSRRTGLRDLSQLVDAGVLDRLGKRRGARYRRAGTLAGG